MAVLSSETRASDDAGARFVAQFAVNDADVVTSQQLRYRIFAGEMRAAIDGGADQVDADRYDAYCHHLLVRDTTTDEVIASTRLLTCEDAARAGGFYSAGEFDMHAIDTLSDRKVEVGRTCVDARYRNGTVIATLWTGLARFVTQHNYRYLFGCASIGLDDGGAQAGAILDKINRRYLASESLRVTPRVPYPSRLPAAEVAMRLPPLLKAYLSLGAQACGAPYWDRDFNCCDVLMLVDISTLNPRYARRFNLGGGSD